MKILFQGYSGKMGSLLYEELKTEHDFPFLVDKDYRSNGNELDAIDLVLDFSTAKSAYALASKALSRKIPVVSGTTGLSEKELEELNNLATFNKVGIYVVSNFDPSFNKFLSSVVQFDGLFDKVIISDWHHKSKADAPSGTSIMLGKSFKKTRVVYLSYRVDKFIYKHLIHFEDQNLRLNFQHSVKDKKVYVGGVKRALATVNEFIGLRTSLL